MSEEVSNRYPEMNDPGATAMLSAIKLEDLEPDELLPLGPEPEPAAEPAAEPEAASLEALPLMPAPPAPQKKQGYAGVVIAALLSAALIAGTLYFFYSHYMKSHAQSQSIEQPADATPANPDQPGSNQ
jgi:uncharacterized protein HemX